jgi:hypothetical protein
MWGASRNIKEPCAKTLMSNHERGMEHVITNAHLMISSMASLRLTNSLHVLLQQMRKSQLNVMNLDHRG